MVETKRLKTKTSDRASDSCVPLATTVVSEAAVSKADAGEAVDHLDAPEIFGRLVPKLSLHVQAQRSPMGHR
jgi:hypothetical protein